MIPSHIRKMVEAELYTVNEYGFRHQIPGVKPSESLVGYFKQNYNIRTDVHNMCVACQIRQLTKYDEGTSEGKPFAVNCKFVPKSIPGITKTRVRELATANDIPEERARKLLLAAFDPVAWAELFFGFDDNDPVWRLRSYQKDQIRCTALRMALREGRRSGKTFGMAVKLLNFSFTFKVHKGFDSEGQPVEEGPEILIITPYQAQLTNLFEEMEKLLKRSPELRKSVTTGTGASLYVKTPVYRMAFKGKGGSQGAVIQGFVSGLGLKEDGSGGGTIRGQGANIIYGDELDMIPDDILDKVVDPILLTTPETIMIATSTPIGKRGKFYRWCKERPTYKEDYYPSTVLPHWDDVKEEAEEESTKESFDTEYMAEFIEGQYGVYRPSWVQLAREEYEYFDGRERAALKAALNIDDPANMIVAMGIDWNKNAGTEFYVVGYSSSRKLWFGLDAVNIGASVFSAQRWTKELIDLNFKWKPNWIYADAGFGHIIIEDVHYYAYSLRAKKNKTLVDLETIKLADKLIAFDFSGNVVIKDPTTGEDIKKPGKHFIVENMVRTLEDGLFKFPSSDELLRKQFLNYVIKKRNVQTGKPIYGMEKEKIGDHRHDACILALAAITIEESIYSGKLAEMTPPTYVKKDLLHWNQAEEDFRNQSEEFANRARQGKIDGVFGVLDILRDKSGKQQNSGRSPLTGNSKGRRSNFSVGPEEPLPSILGGIEKNIRGENSGTFVGGIPRAGKPHRSIRRGRIGGRNFSRR